MANCRKWRSQAARRRCSPPLGGTRRQLGKQGCNHLFPGRPKSDAAHQCRWDGHGASHTEHQGRRRSVPPLARSFFPTATISYFGPVTSETSRTTARAASTSVLSRARKENLFVLCHSSFGYDAPTICFMQMTNDSWSGLLLTPPPVRFREVRPWSRMPSDSNPPPTGRLSL